jgi:DNA-binding transcriptional LysR family regulator
MKLTQIRDVIAVAERGSFRGAARQLGIAQPAITRSIREIEHELGVALFERRARGIILTPMGETFLHRALAVQNELRQAQEEIEQMKGRSSGQVAIALSTASHIALLPLVLKPFRQKYPDVRLQVIESLFTSVDGALKDGTIDFYVGPLPELPLPKELATEKLFDNTRLIFGRKGHPLARAKSLRDLRDAAWITTSVTTNSEAELGPPFALHGLAPPKIEMRAPSALTMVLAAGYSDLLMMLPEQWLDFPLTRELLQPFPVAEVFPAAPICIVSRVRLPPTPAAEYFADLVRRAAVQHVALRKKRPGRPGARTSSDA